MARRASRNSSLQPFEVAGQHYVRLEVPLRAELPATLTEAEREVVALIVAGKSNAEIANARGVAVRTIANQVASILRKLEVGSRSALLAKVAGVGD